MDLSGLCFQSVAEPDKAVFNDDLTQLTISFSTRAAAEKVWLKNSGLSAGLSSIHLEWCDGHLQAYKEGANFQGKPLTVQWVQAARPAATHLPAVINHGAATKEGKTKHPGVEDGEEKGSKEEEGEGSVDISLGENQEVSIIIVTLSIHLLHYRLLYS